MPLRWHWVNMAENVYNRGILIAIEGTDGSHKSYLCDRLVGYLCRKGYPAKLFRFPDRTTDIGKLLDRHLKGEIAMTPHVSHLLFSANRMEKIMKIESLLTQGYHVLVDRYIYSGIAYSLSKNNATLDITRAWVTNIESILPEPNLIFWPKYSADYILGNKDKFTSRIFGETREIYDEPIFQARVADQFDYLTSLTDTKHLWHVLDAEEETREEIFNSVCETVEKRILQKRILPQQ